MKSSPGLLISAVVSFRSRDTWIRYILADGLDDQTRGIGGRCKRPHRTGAGKSDLARDGGDYLKYDTSYYMYLLYQIQAFLASY